MQPRHARTERPGAFGWHNPHKTPIDKTQESQLVTYDALNSFIMNCYDVKNLSACLGEIVNPRATQIRPMDVSTIRITMDDSRKTSAYISF